MRQTLSVELNQNQQILALVKSMAKLPRSATEPGFHPEWINEYVLLWNTYGQLACTDISSCHSIPSPLPLYCICLLLQPQCLAGLLSDLSPVPYRGLFFCFFCFLMSFSESLLMFLSWCQCNSLAFHLQFIISIAPSSQLLSLLSCYWLSSWCLHFPLLSDLCSSFLTFLSLFPTFTAVFWS